MYNRFTWDFMDNSFVWKKQGNVGEILSSDKSVEYAEYFRPKFEEILDNNFGGFYCQSDNKKILNELIECLKNPTDSNCNS
jgi:hypothetical protein